METIAFCEQDKYCQQVLKKHWPEIPIHDDIKELCGEQYRGTVDLVCGGYPCQPFSQAGKQKGHKDDRHLWPEMYRIIKQCRPAWVVAENVAGHIRMGLDQVLADLENEGYTTRPVVIPACAIDAHHRRDRVWIIAHNAERSNRPHNAREEERQEQKFRESDSRGIIPGTNSKQAKRPTISWEKCHSWPIEPDICRVANGVPRRVDRLRALGNAVVPQVVEKIGRSIMEANND
tara:strand:- start:573 stop:1271 length:699 start_codon:yes stop_codon:yes gene_type:complete